MRKWIGWSGIGAAGLFGAGNALWAFEAPRPGAPADELVEFYERAARRIVVGDSLSLFAVALFVFFAAGMRRELAAAAGDDVLATTAFGGAVLGAAAGLGAETIHMAAAMRAREGDLSGELARPLFETSQVLGYNAAGAGLGTFALATSAVALRARELLPRPLAWLTAATGAALLTPLSRVVLAPGVVLLGAISVRLLRAR